MVYSLSLASSSLSTLFLSSLEATAMEVVILFTILILVSISDVRSLVGGGGAQFHSYVLPVQRKFKGVSTEHDRSRHLASAVDLPLGRDWLYYTRVRVGSPAHDNYVFVDTGSDLFWVKCDQKDLYYPGRSRTANAIPCDHALCYPGACKRSSRCNYQMDYADFSSSNGYLVADLVQFDIISGNSTTSLINTSIIFGCGVLQSGGLTQPGAGRDGLVGFGRSELSILSQLAKSGLTERCFSHCLTAEFDTGIFVIGRVDHPKVNTTPLTKNKDHYNVNMLAIEVDKYVFELGNGIETTIDSGSTLSYLPEEIYEVVKNKILFKHPNLKLFLFGDNLHCFHFNASVDLEFPTISLHFEGSLQLTVYPREYLFQPKDYTYCLGWRDSRSLAKGAENYAILGDIVLQDKFFFYDIENEMIGWTPYDCLTSVGVQDGSTVYQVGPRQTYAPPHDNSAPPHDSSSAGCNNMGIVCTLLATLMISFLFWQVQINKSACWRF